MVLTGRQIVEFGIVNPGLLVKIDDGVIPSFGAEPNGYTLTADCQSYKIVLPPRMHWSFRTNETVHMPENMVGFLYAKSTYARKGLVLVTNTPVDAGYHGRLSMLFYNTSSEPVDLFGIGGFMQMCVHTLADIPDELYKGRWQDGA